MPDATPIEKKSVEALLEDARRVLDIATAAGADDAVASVATERGLEFRWRDGQLENVTENAARGLTVALYVDGRYSAHTTNDLDPERLAAFLGEAVALTRHLQEDPFRLIPDPALYEGRADVDLDVLDPALLTLSREERLQACKAMEAEASADDRVVSTTTQVQDAHAASASVSTNGFAGTHEATSAVYAAQVALKEGETKRPEDHYVAFGTHIGDLPEASGIGAEALRRAKTRLGSGKVSSRRTTMVLHPEAGASLVGRLLGALAAGAVQQKRSFLADKQGQQIASPLLTITDDPLVVRGLASRLFDGEGIAAKARPLISDGVLETFYVDTYYGKKLGWAPTSGRPSNLLFRHGEQDLDGIVSGLDDGILVTGWVGGNADPTSGDFSFGVRGHVVKSGTLAEPISEMNVTGSYLDLLGRLSVVGNDPVPWYPCRAPTLVFDDIQFSGS